MKKIMSIKIKQRTKVTLLINIANLDNIANIFLVKILIRQ